MIIRSAKLRIALLSMVALISVGMAVALPKLAFQFDLDRFFPRHDPGVAFLEAFEARFASSRNYLTVGFELEGSLFQAGRMARLDSLSNRLDSVPGIRKVESLTTITYPILSWLGRTERAFLHPHQPERAQQDSVWLFSYPDTRSPFLSSDARATCLFLELDSMEQASERMTQAETVKRLAAASGLGKPILYGEFFSQDSHIQELQEELRTLSGLGVLLMLLVLWLSFRSWAGIGLPLLVIGLAVLWTLGTMALLGISLNLMTVLIPLIVSIVAMSDVVHVLAGYRSQEIHLPPEEAIRLVWKKTGVAILLTSLTTSIGFLSVAISDVPMIIEFGLFTAYGVMLAYVLTLVLMPMLLPWCRREAGPQEQAVLSRWMARQLFPWIARRKLLVLGSSLVLLGVAALGIRQVKVNASLYQDLSAEDEFSLTLDFFERYFSGIRGVEVALAVADSQRTLLDPASLEKMDRLHQYLEKQFGLGQIQDLTVVLKQGNRSMNAGRPAYFHLPDDPEIARFLQLQCMANFDDLHLETVVSRDFRQGRMVGRIQDLGSAEMERRNAAFEAFVADSLDAGWLSVELTGIPLLLDRSHRKIADSLFVGLILAMTVISMILGWLFRSLTMTLIALIANLLPLFFVLGYMGWGGVDMNFSTAIIFTIAFGIAVDDTIHMMGSYRTERKSGHSAFLALENTFFTTGKAVVVTSLVLVIGFGLLMLSSFPSTGTTGSLLSLALVLAVLGDVVVLPALLLVFDKRNNQSGEEPGD